MKPSLLIPNQQPGALFSLLIWAMSSWRWISTQASFPASYVSLPESRWVSVTVDGTNPANQFRLVAYPIMYRVLYIPGG